jgi:hypothetical protein
MKRSAVASTWNTPTYPVLDGAVPLELTQLWHAWAIPALCSDSAPLVEVHVANAGLTTMRTMSNSAAHHRQRTSTRATTRSRLRTSGSVDAYG